MQRKIIKTPSKTKPQSQKEHCHLKLFTWAMEGANERSNTNSQVLHKIFSWANIKSPSKRKGQNRF